MEKKKNFEMKGEDCECVCVYIILWVRFEPSCAVCQVSPGSNAHSLKCVNISDQSLAGGEKEEGMMWRRGREREPLGRGGGRRKEGGGGVEERELVFFFVGGASLSSPSALLSSNFAF